MKTHPGRCQVLHVIEPMEYGGAESVVVALARGVAARGDRVLVASLQQGNRTPTLVNTLREADIEVAEIACGRRSYIREAAVLSDLVRRHNADVVHTHVYHADVIGFIAARRARRPVVATAHGFTGGGWRGRLYERLDIACLRRMDAVLCVSESVAARVRTLGCAERVHLVPNGHGGVSPLPRAHARRALGLPDDGRVIGWIGRLSPEKAPDRFVDALAALDRPGVTGIIVGDGPEREAIMARIAALGAAVAVAGAHPEAGRLVSAFDLLAITSRTEGLPMTLLDAMSAGVPVVAFGVGAVPDALPISAGWIVAPDDTEAFIRAVRQALDDPDDARARAAASRQVLYQRFSLERWLERVDAVYARAAR